MALPALRQPKFVATTPKTSRKQVLSDTNYVILTLKNNSKLVVTSDAYHGIITEEEMHKCVFCGISVERDANIIEMHKKSSSHKVMMSGVPYIDDFSDNLMRQLNKIESYCTICNVILPSYSVVRHIATEVHTDELDKAYARGLAYKPQT